MSGNRRASCPVNGAAVRALRLAKGLSVPTMIARLKDEAGLIVHQTTISKIETGDRQTSPELLVAMAAVLKVDQAAIAGAPKNTADDASAVLT